MKINRFGEKIEIAVQLTPFDLRHSSVEIVIAFVLSLKKDVNREVGGEIRSCLICAAIYHELKC